MTCKRFRYGNLLSVMLAALLCAGMFAGCKKGSAQQTAVDISVSYSDDDLNAAWDDAQNTSITFSGGSITVDGKGASATGSTVLIHSKGTYVLSGTLDDGQIIVSAKDGAKVQLVLNGASVTCSTGAPLYVKSADKTVITLAEGTQNRIADTRASVSGGANAQDATVFSEDDLTVNGTGSLEITSAAAAGIECNDTLKIVSGTIGVTAATDGMRGNDCIAIKDGRVTVTACLDGLESATGVLVSGGEVMLTTGGGSAVNSRSDSWGDWGREGQGAKEDTASAKGIKATGSIEITGGTVHIDSSDDALHANGSITVKDGTLSIASGDDGIHADTAITISGGSITITESYEGIESASIAFSGGETRVTSSDDGINTAGGQDGSSVNGRPGQNNFNVSDGSKLSITGGSIHVNASGDGIDANGDITMSGGVVTVSGPTENMNGALDFASFTMTGGTVAAAGSAGMAMAPEGGQNSLLVGFDTVLTAGTKVCIRAADGTELLSFTPEKEYQTLAFSSPALATGQSITISTGGIDVYTLTVSSGLNTAGNVGNGGFGMPGGRR